MPYIHTSSLVFKFLGPHLMFISLSKVHQMCLRWTVEMVSCYDLCSLPVLNQPGSRILTKFPLCVCLCVCRFISFVIYSGRTSCFTESFLSGYVCMCVCEVWQPLSVSDELGFSHDDFPKENMTKRSHYLHKVSVLPSIFLPSSLPLLILLFSHKQE